MAGQSLLDYFGERNKIIKSLTDFLKTNPNQLFDRVTSIHEELINKNREIKNIKSKLAYLKYSSLLSSVEKIGQYSFIISQIDGLDGDSLQTAALDLTSKLGEKSGIVLVSVPEEVNQKVLFIISFGSDLVALGLHAGKLINEMAKICSGGGGGKSNIAQAGAKNVSQINQSLNFGKQYLVERLAD